MRRVGPVLKRLSQWEPSERLVSLLLGCVAFAGILWLQNRGVLQGLEFQVYDLLIRQQPAAPSSEPLVLVEMVESDIQDPALDYPLHDDKMAELLTVLEAGAPTVIGLDIWRDVPVPKSGVGLPQLNQVLQAHSNIIGIFTLEGIRPPAVLKDNAERIAFNDNFPVDVEVAQTVPKVRRSLLFGDRAPGEIYDSLPFRLALVYLQARGIAPEADPQDANSLWLGKARLRRFQRNDGLYVGADAKGWQMLLDFKCPEKFTRFSVSDVLQGRVPPGALRDKIVLVGINAPSVEDSRVTPLHRSHRGIEVQAMTVNQLLRHALNGAPPIRFWNQWWENAWLLGWCLAGAAIGSGVRSVWKIALGTTAGLVGLPGVAWMAFGAGWWIPLTTPALGFLGAFALSIAQASARERKMRSTLMKLYSRHVSKEIAEEIWARRASFLDGQKPIAQKLLVTVLFTDLKGFSTISERMEPAVLYDWLNDYLGAMSHVIQSHGGVIKQFTGDGILALFGVPVPHTTRQQQEADAQAAVSCALAMGRRLVELVRQWQQAGLPAVSMRAGIHTGNVAAGSVGSDERFEYAVVGDVVNTAARLESYDKSLADPDLDPLRCRILIGGPTQELLGPSFQTKEIGLIEVKGKVNKVPVFQVLGRTEMPQ
jgi:adenylate cyclase